MTKRMKVEQDAELPKPRPMCSTSHASFSSSKSRQNLTEAEKEARRVRRVLANRESARQTIRRRQALYEELTRKAASLARENENLKRETELAVKEYNSLKSANECLKAQMAKTIKTKVEDPQVDSKSTNADISSSLSTSCPILLYNQPPFSPFLWPPIIQSSNPVQLQHMSQNAMGFPSKVPMLVIAKPDSFHEQENLLKVNGPGTPVYILPCPWFFPRPDHENETSMNTLCGASSSSKTSAHVEKPHPFLPVKVKTEACSSVEAIPANNLHETPVGFPPDGRGQHTGFPPSGLVLVPAPLNSVKPTSTVKHETCEQPDYIRYVQAFSSPVSHTVSALPETKQDLIICPSKKQVDDIAAATEARKRRKEITKLKSLHCRQFRIHC